MFAIVKEKWQDRNKQHTRTNELRVASYVKKVRKEWLHYEKRMAEYR